MASLSQSRPIGRGGSWGLRHLLIAGVIGAAIAWVLGGGWHGHSTSDISPQNLAAGFVNSVRVGDPWACDMATPKAARQLSRLVASPAQVADATARGLDVCGTVVSSASSQSRARAMLPFLSVAGEAPPRYQDTAGGETTEGGDTVEWSQASDGGFAILRLHQEGASGWLVSSIQLRSSCSICQ